MPQLLHFLKVDQGTQINRLKCLDRDEGGGVEEAAPVSDKDVFFNKTNEVRGHVLSLYLVRTCLLMIAHWFTAWILIVIDRDCEHLRCSSAGHRLGHHRRIHLLQELRAAQ